MTTATDTDLDLIQELEFAPPCEYTNGGTTTCDRPAELIVYYSNPAVCGCTWDKPFLLYCEPCWTRRNSHSMVNCPDCGYLSDPWEDIIRVERLK